MTYHQNVGLNHNKKVTNKSLKCEGFYIYGCNYNKLNQIYIPYLRVNSFWLSMILATDMVVRRRSEVFHWNYALLESVLRRKNRTYLENRAFDKNNDRRRNYKAQNFLKYCYIILPLVRMVHDVHRSKFCHWLCGDHFFGMESWIFRKRSILQKIILNIIEKGKNILKDRYSILFLPLIVSQQW